MIDAKNKFREGFIMLTRPFQFAELEEPLQQLTILWAYSEQPVIKKVLTAEAIEKVDLIENQTPPLFLNTDDKETWLDEELEKVYSKPQSYENLYEGEIVQCVVKHQTCRFYPDEYKIMSKEKIFEIMQEEGYHTIIAEEIKQLKDFKDKAHYLSSRGISKEKAEKWASLSFQGNVMYKPYYQLLDMFARVIYKDPFYERVEGINFEAQEETV